MILIYKNDGTGNFPETELIDETVQFASQIIAQDFDYDNDVDLVFNGIVSGESSVYLIENQNGSFVSPVNLLTEGNGHDIGLGDINGNGINDIIVANQTFIEFSWIEIQSNGNFNVTNFESVDSHRPENPIIMDINGDGFGNPVFVNDSQINGASQISYIKKN